MVGGCFITKQQFADLECGMCGPVFCGGCGKKILCCLPQENVKISKRVFRKVSPKAGN